MNTIDLYGDVTTLRMILNDTLDVFEDDEIEVFNANTFAYHATLTALSLPNATSFTANMPWCANLQVLNLPKAKIIGGTIHNSSLGSVSLPEVTSIEYNASGLFSGCKDLTSVSLPKLTGGINSYVFMQCSSLSYVSAPSTVGIGQQAFSSCTSLTSVSFPLAKSVSYDAFYHCSSLHSVDLPQLTSISAKAFAGCLSLASLSFPELQIIGGTSVFSGCILLTSLTLGWETSICTLSSTSSFTDTPIASGTGHIYVPTSLYSQYITATNWSDFASSITTISS